MIGSSLLGTATSRQRPGVASGGNLTSGWGVCNHRVKYSGLLDGVHNFGNLPIIPSSAHAILNPSISFLKNDNSDKQKNTMQRRGRTIQAAHPSAESSLAWPSHAERLALQLAYWCVLPQALQERKSRWPLDRPHRPRLWPCPRRHRTSNKGDTNKGRLCGVGGGKPESCKYVATVGNLSMVYIIYLYIYICQTFLYIYRILGSYIYMYYCHYNMCIYIYNTHIICGSHRSHLYLSRWSATRYIWIWHNIAMTCYDYLDICRSNDYLCLICVYTHIYIYHVRQQRPTSWNANLLQLSQKYHFHTIAYRVMAKELILQ